MRDADAPAPEPSSSGGLLDEEGCNGQQQKGEVDENANCTICGAAKSSALLDLRSNQVMQRRLSRDWKMQADVIRSTLKAICVECVCKLNMHSEVTRSLMQRMQRLQHEGSGPSTVTTTTVTPTQLSPPIADAEVSTTLLDVQEVQMPATDQSSRSSRSSCSVLEAYAAQPPESPSATESGGTRNNSVNAQDGWKWRTRLVCQHCGRTYFRKDYFTVHSRRCRSQRRLPKARCRVLNEAGSDEDTVSPRTLQPSLRPTRTFHCRHCEEEFFTVISLRQHQRNTHQTRHPCSLCEASFDTKYEWELHHTICSAKHEALEIHHMDETTHKGRARSTRSRSRACSEHWNKYTTNAQVDDDDSECEEQELEENEHDDQVDTMYTRRMNFTGDWIVNHSRSNSNSALNLSRLYDNYVLEESHIRTVKEYDLHMLNLLKAQVQLNEFVCFTCGYQTDSLSELMKHDYMRHWKMSWFYCQKCGDVFTSKVFLDYHLHRQNRGVYICHKCQDEFEYQNQLDCHLVLHDKGINYQCNFCRLAFLSEAKLLAHCARCGHSPNDDPPLIRIERAISISNYPPGPEISNQKWEYEERELLLPGDPMPSSRPMHLPNHKPFRFAIGICDFENRHQPNCAGCQ
ncbi:zinc finger protein 888 [Drosophila guanche]|uniref:Blast:Zinc finger and BTB domain-containing protein 48 n=1 Tax=Drosophila guanche TaxID=7266 RepID=A0A3B0IY58_DROGU|nr:zinc finger protein 888 [Drosophila guanche]SPP72675.1 blast:Zinc finger and BTB domain-containing protein 48 [Drosophila guanche]